MDLRWVVSKRAEMKLAAKSVNGRVLQAAGVCFRLNGATMSHVDTDVEPTLDHSPVIPFPASVQRLMFSTFGAVLVSLSFPTLTTFLS